MPKVVVSVHYGSIVENKNYSSKKTFFITFGKIFPKVDCFLVLVYTISGGDIYDRKERIFRYFKKF